MKKILLILGLVGALAVQISAQFRANIECKNFVLVSDSTYTGDLKRFVDQTNKNYLPSGAKVGYVVTDANFNNFKIDAINNTTFSSLNVTVTKLANGKNFPPFGSGQISENLKEGFIAVTPDNQSGVSPVVKSSIESEGFKNLADSLHFVLNKLIDTIYYQDSIFVVVFHRKGVEKDTLRFGGGGVSSWNDLADIPPTFADNVDNVDDADNDPNNELDSKWTRSGTNTYLTETGDNVGIGTTTPSAKLEVSEDIKVYGQSIGRGNGGIISNLVHGFRAGEVVTGTNNFFQGYEAGLRTTSGSNNIFQGYRSGWYNTTGHTNIFSGWESGYNNTTGFNNIFQGYRSGYFNSTGQANLFQGYISGLLNTTGSFNNFQGYSAGRNNTSGNFNLFLGYQAGYNNTTGFANISTGYNSAFRNTTGFRNVNIGFRAGYENITGHSNINIGYEAGYFETGNHKLYIDNSNTTTPLIFGDFNTNEIKINGDFQATGNIKDSDGDDGANGQKLISTGTGTNWVDDSGAVETDPVFVASQANNITNSGSGLVVTGTERTNWNNAFSWGDHSGLYENAFAKNSAFNKNFGTTAGTVLEGNTVLFDGAWSSLSGVPAGFADGVDNDTDTNNYPTSLSVTGTSTKTITIGRNGLSNLVATFTDESGSGGDGNNYVSGLSFTTPSNILTLNRLGLSDLNLSLSNIQPAWNNITGMPSGFADGVDNTGSDGNNYPTSFSTLSNNILTLNRNGLSPITTDLSPLQANWNLIFNKPSGFSDNVDNNDYISSSTLSNTTLNLNGSGSAGTAINLINVTDFSSVDYITSATQANNTYTSSSPTYIQTAADNILLSDNRAGRMFVIQVHSGNAQINTTSGTVIVDGIAYTSGSYNQPAGTTHAYIRNDFNSHWYVLKF